MIRLNFKAMKVNKFCTCYTNKSWFDFILQKFYGGSPFNVGNVKLFQPPVILCEPEPGGGYLLPPGRPIVEVGPFYTSIYKFELE